MPAASVAPVKVAAPVTPVVATPTATVAPKPAIPDKKAEEKAEKKAEKKEDKPKEATKGPLLDAEIPKDV